MIIPLWLLEIEEHLRNAWQAPVRALTVAVPAAKISIGSGAWGIATGANGYGVSLSCVWPDASDEPDEIALCVDFSHIDSRPEFEAYVCWGHPGGYIEAEFAAEEVECSSESIERLFDRMPGLLEAFERGAKRGCPAVKNA